jgi:serine protease Do
MITFIKKYHTLPVILLSIGGMVKLYNDHEQFNRAITMLKAQHANLKTVQPCAQQENQKTWATTQAKVKDTVVQVFSQLAEIDLLEPYKSPSQGQGFGSGFFINDQGELVTNAHVVSHATSVWIQIPSLGKRVIDVEIVGVCPERDLALLRLTPENIALIKQVLGSIPYLKLGDSDAIYRADEILALGYPLGQNSLKSTTGVVSGRENIAGQHFIQMDAPINPGSSGGPSVNRYSEVIGINSAGIIQGGVQNVGYVIPVNELKIILDDLHKEKLLRKPFLGIRPMSGSEALTAYLGNPQPGGCYVAEVYKGSPLEKAGVLKGDMVYEINGYPVDVYGEMTVPWSEDKITISDYISRLKLGEKVHLVFYRKGIRKQVTINFDYTDLMPIRIMYPDYEEIPYEIIAGMVIVPLTLNHVALLHNHVPHLAHYTEIKEQQEPVLLMSHLFPDSQTHRSRALGIGALIQEVNGVPVKTIAALRAALIKGKDETFLTIKTNNAFAAFPLAKVLKDEPRFSQLYRYPISPTIQTLLQAVQLKAE